MEGILFHCEDVGNRFLSNVGKFLPHWEVYLVSRGNVHRHRHENHKSLMSFVERLQVARIK
jgi:hypothetical protein